MRGAFGHDLCYSYPQPKDNPAYQQLAMQENITTTDLFNVGLNSVADKFEPLINIAKWLMAYLAIVIAILNLYIYFMNKKRRDEGMDWIELKDKQG